VNLEQLDRIRDLVRAALEGKAPAAAAMVADALHQVVQQETAAAEAAWQYHQQAAAEAAWQYHQQGAAEAAWQYHQQTGAEEVDTT
jgi:hypothetical protein